MNKKQRLNQAGIAHIGLVLAVIIIAVVGFAAYRVGSKNKDQESPVAKTSNSESAKSVTWPMEEGISWEATGQGGWITLPYDKAPPACPDPLEFKSPADVSKATSILYPGQTRLGTFEGKGGNYKPHGGFRFNKSSNTDIAVTMPFDGYVTRGSRFTTDGEIQYDFDIVNPCGIMVRLGHLRELTPEFQAIAEKFPAAVEGDSRTTKVQPNLPFKTGDKIATSVGFKNTKNVGFDFGVYDLKNDNEASKDPVYQKAHADTAELSSHALCWLGMLGDKDSATVKSLPAGDQVSGKKSDYCK